ncbi:DUF4178 domain-containing protein [Chryseobacterium sp. CH25]|uniref:DUF4178 domain-containing protein n=2 Tax=unclassified Chryseobacterium TaxID=2593645 RepID=UPI00100A820C|nr:DUF4178 domain-containing protein [Chryseobacterium sp. CH25]RXM51894.1 hypothetical protein BOQ64_08450 [Chryseobacterium sp. CH25]
MDQICPHCGANNNEMAIDFAIEEFICSHCNNLVTIGQSTQRKIVKKPVENVVLEVGRKGILYGTEYWVINIVIKKYGSDTFWREYSLKDRAGNNVYLSESDGHWVLLRPVDFAFKEFKYYAEANGKNYRWFETTPCTVYAATGFFEDKLQFGLATYKEYVNGTEMISREEYGKSVQFFKGNHISRFEIKKAFGATEMPYRTGTGIVQPFYFNVKQCTNIMAITALLICILQLYVVTSRSNQTIFEQRINFTDVTDKEVVSKSFTLSGGSAPLQVYASSNVDNSWANVGLSLVNEKTNEVIYASKDIEQYSGYEDGESWSEGSQTEEFNLCGIPGGTYHFLISAEKEGGAKDPFKSGYRPANSDFSIVKNDTGSFFLKNDKNQTVSTYNDIEALTKDIILRTGLQNTTKETGKLDSILLNMPQEYGYPESYDKNPAVNIKATWLPVSFWNFGIVLVCLIIFVVGSHWMKRTFEYGKWNNSSNSPYANN